MIELGIYKNIIIDIEAPDGAERLREIRLNNQDKTIGFGTGCYDVAQPGHEIFFEQMSQIADVVVVGVGRDEVVRALKREPVNDEWNRAYLVASMKPVDYVVLDSMTVGEGKNDFEKALEALHPDFLF